MEGAGYWVIVWTGPSFGCSEVCRRCEEIPRRRRARRRIGRGTRVDEEESKIPLDGIYASAGMMIRSVHPRQPMWLTLILAIMKRVVGAVTAVMMMLKTAQIR